MLATNGPQDSGPVLRGRASECARLDELLSAVRRGESGAFVVRGEAGMGKTALLKYLAGQSGECLIVRAVGVEAEMELPFAILHQLCLPVLDRAEQRRAMSSSSCSFRERARRSPSSTSVARCRPAERGDPGPPA